MNFGEINDSIQRLEDRYRVNIARYDSEIIVCPLFVVVAQRVARMLWDLTPPPGIRAIFKSTAYECE